jgi:hypothetical protein
MMTEKQLAKSSTKVYEYLKTLLLKFVCTFFVASTERQLSENKD